MNAVPATVKKRLRRTTSVNVSKEELVTLNPRYQQTIRKSATDESWKGVFDFEPSATSSCQSWEGMMLVTGGAAAGWAVRLAPQSRCPDHTR